MTSPNPKSFIQDIEAEMRVTKRNGSLEDVSFDKIMRRIKTLGKEANIKLNYTSLAMKVIDQLYDTISTTKIDELTADQCASLSSTHPDYNVLAGRIIISNHHKNTTESFSDVMEQLYNFKDKHNHHTPLISDELYNVVVSNKDQIDDICIYDRDYLIDYFGFKTLERAYLLQINRKPIERPQHLWLRVAIGIHGFNMDKVKETYEYMSQKYFTHATPTLFNAGTPHPQLSSCFLSAMETDSIEGIYNTLKDCALISKWAGGIGLHIHNVRASGSHIRGTNGSSNGIVPMLRVFNNTAKYVDQCVLPETKIYTDRGLIPISQCVPGKTAIYNRTGKFEIISDVLEHSYQGKIINIHLTNNIMHPLRVTPEHPVYILPHYGFEPEQIINEDMKRGLTRLSWIEARDINYHDLIAIPIPSYIHDYPELTEKICYYYGLILAHITPEILDANIDSDIFICGGSNTKMAELGYFLLDNSIQCETIINGMTSAISWKKSPSQPFRSSDFYDVNTRTLAIGERWLNLPPEKIQKILDGLGKSTHINTFDLCLRLGKIENSNVKKIDGYLLSTIENIYTTNYEGLVYDLVMPTEHNYFVEGGLVHNGGGKRNGSFAIYLEPWHADVEMFLQMRKNHGDEELKARDLFYALWIPDLFMERVKNDDLWTLMCPDECPGLSDVYGDAFAELYLKYEKSGKGRKSIRARSLWFQILDAQMETGTPYLLYKDACNRKSNQQNVGTIKSSNLCSEIIEYSDENETAVCNLASIGLPAFVNNGVFDYDKLHKVSKIITYNLNRIIDINYYPIEKTRVSNMRHRPIGIGVQGLADVFLMLGMSFLSDSAKEINKRIFETIYHGALESSMELSIIDGPYSTFAGSPASKGKLQFDLWNHDPGSSNYDWKALKTDIQKHGLRNSLLLAPMPTASTSQILGYNECIEPITSNIYSRRTIAGEFIITNKYLMRDLISLELWNEDIKNNIISNNGSIQQIEIIPLEIRNKYKTVWELPMRGLIDMAADRGVYICQSQSLNLWLEDPNYNTLTSMHFYSWSKGLKTGIYYLRRRGKHQAQQFTIEPTVAKNNDNEDDHICELCSS